MRSLMYLGLIMWGMLGVAIAAPIDFATELTQIDGKPFLDKEGKPEKVTLGTICETALLATYPEEETANAKADGLEVGKEKARRYRIAQKIRNGKDVELPVEDIQLIKRLVGKGYQPYVVGRVWELLDPASVK